jgi:hypothetical protein
MAVKLDWEIDDVDAPLPGIETETSGGTGCRRWWRLLALIMLVAAIGLGYLGLKLHQKKSEIEGELRAVVELELNAFINDDRDLYLAQQDPHSGRWRREQETGLDDYHTQVERSAWDETWFFAAYTGQVPVVRVEGDQGWALVEVARGESAWREMWFYQWTQADGWRHVRLDPDWPGDEQEHATSHLRLTYPERDADLVAALADEMEGWYEILAPLFGVDLAGSFPPPLPVRFSVYDSPYRPNKVNLHWRCTPLTLTLIAPSPHQGRFSADNTPGPEMRQQMATRLAEALIAYQSDLCPDTALPVEISALRHELRDWAVAYLARTWPDLGAWNAPPTPLVEALVARQGIQVIHQLAAHLHGPETLDQVLAAANLDPPDPMTRFAFLLVADSRAMHDLNLHDYEALADPQANRTWRDYRTEQWSWQYQFNTFDDTWPLRVESVVFNGEMAWVEAKTTRPDGSTQRQTHFFRQAGERWLLTSPDPAYFGQARTTQTENLTFHYLERDVQWFEEAVPTRLQAALDQAVVDLDLPTRDFTFTVETDMRGLYSWTSGSNVIKLASPSLANWPGVQPEKLAASLAQPLLSLLASRFDTDMSTGFGYPAWAVKSAIIQWEIRRLFPEQAASLWPAVDAAKVATLSLDDLGTTVGSDLASRQQRRFQEGYRTLVEYLAETYGPEAVVVLLENLPQPGGLEAWLLLSTGHGVEEVEPGWQAWVLATYQGQ